MIRLAAAAMSLMEPVEDGERGVIVNTASIAATEGLSGQAAYSASKGGVASMTLPLARELAGFGIRVVAVAPGMFETGMTSDIPDRTKAVLIKDIQFPRRLGHPAEFGEAVAGIVTNRMFNGCIIRLDAGLRMRDPDVA